MARNYVRCRKSIFTVYCGLIASGYNLTDIVRAEHIYHLISQIDCEYETKNYFNKAKTASCEVNPYWPRAFLLTLASFYINDDLNSYNDFQTVISHIESLDNMNPTEINEEVIEWLKQLPYYLNKISNSSSFNQLWEKYMDYELEQSAWISSEVERVLYEIEMLIGATSIDLPEVVFVPNCLQACQLTDYVRKDNIIYIIKSRPDIESIVHEYLHEILNKYLLENSRLIEDYGFLLEPVIKEMHRYQYAWNIDVDSWKRVFEENFMRAASVWVTYRSNIDNGYSICDIYYQQGFKYTPVIYECLINEWKDISSFKEFISSCLVNSKKKVLNSR
jgi:hypothetical protein